MFILKVEMRGGMRWWQVERQRERLWCKTVIIKELVTLHRNDSTYSTHCMDISMASVLLIIWVFLSNKMPSKWRIVQRGFCRQKVPIARELGLENLNLFFVLKQAVPGCSTL